jgi:hypothetical protein
MEVKISNLENDEKIPENTTSKGSMVPLRSELREVKN